MDLATSRMWMGQHSHWRDYSKKSRDFSNQSENYTGFCACQLQFSESKFERSAHFSNSSGNLRKGELSLYVARIYQDFRPDFLCFQPHHPSPKVFHGTGLHVSEEKHDSTKIELTPRDDRCDWLSKHSPQGRCN